MLASSSKHHMIHPCTILLFRSLYHFTFFFKTKTILHPSN
jgi:hypothetical protein